MEKQRKPMITKVFRKRMVDTSETHSSTVEHSRVPLSFRQKKPTAYKSQTPLRPERSKEPSGIDQLNREEVFNSTWKLTKDDWVPLCSERKSDPGKFPNNLFDELVKKTDEPRGIFRSRRKYSSQMDNKRKLYAIYKPSPDPSLFKRQRVHKF